LDMFHCVDWKLGCCYLSRSLYVTDAYMGCKKHKAYKREFGTKYNVKWIFFSQDILKKDQDRDRIFKNFIE